MTQNTCANCRFWDTSLFNGYGDCHANAPVASTVDRWPVSEAHDWCGQWQPVNSQPSPNDRQIRSLLVERVDQAIASADEDCLAPSWAPEARAAIRAVAEWLRGHHADGEPVAATALEREARR